MKTILFSAVLVLGQVAGAQSDPIVGTWASETSAEGTSLHVKIETCGPAICGTLVRTQGDEGTSVMDRRMVWDMTPEGGGAYSGGLVWAPDTDITYQGQLLLKGDQLTMSGCAVGGLLCRGIDFTRME